MDYKNSAIEIIQEDDDILLGSTLIPTAPTYTLYEYNQKLVDDWACVFMAGIASIGDSVIKQRSLDELLELKALAPQYGRAPNVGMTISRGADLVIDFAKKKGYTYVKKTIGLKDLARLYLDAGREIHTGGKVNSKYYNDMQEDGDLDLNSFGAMEYGHSFRLKKINGVYCIIDNYVGHLKYNIVKINDLDGLLNGGNMFNSGIIYIPNGQQTPMNTRNVPYIAIEKAGENAEIVKAWLKEVSNEKLGYKNYTDSQAYTKMLIDLNEVRKGR